MLIILFTYEIINTYWLSRNCPQDISDIETNKNPSSPAKTLYLAVGYR